MTSIGVSPAPPTPPLPPAPPTPPPVPPVPSPPSPPLHPTTLSAKEHASTAMIARIPTSCFM
ncbi:MAG: hypothetical protein DRH30_06535 [Deltaproteobacteria bacterium]|nr:MAG: hypothetical protein DRH30_06535 [Deltaproteobacteria bacterium]